MYSVVLDCAIGIRMNQTEALLDGTGFIFSIEVSHRVHLSFSFAKE